MSAFHSAVFHRSPLAIALATPLEARFIEVNDTFCRKYGLCREELIGRTYLEVGITIEPVDTLAIADKVGHRENGALEVAVTTPDKRRFWAELWMEFIEIDGKPVVVTYIQDISARKQMEEELRHASRTEAIGQLAGSVAHDFNNLLTTIQGRSELLLQSLPAGSFERHQVDPIHSSVLRAGELTRQLLTFGRKKKTRHAVLDTTELIQGIAAMLRRLLPAGVSLVTDLGDAVSPVRGDHSGLELALTNLVINARDAMPDGGAVRIISRRLTLDATEAQRLALAPGAYVRLQVADTGIGMDEATRARVFEPFFTTKPVGSGTGLGLSSVSGVVAQCGGHIEVASRLGHGTTFTLHLPISSEPAEVKQQSPAAPLPRGTETVLVVEDEEGVRAFCRDVLTACGYSVVVAQDPGEALSNQHEIDLLVCDVMLPQMTGPVLAARMTATRPNLKTLFISGYPGAFFEKSAALPDGHAFLGKPFSVGSLAHQVRSTLDARL